MASRQLNGKDGELFSSISRRRSDGARVIQLPSGSMPTISEWACWEICRVSVLR